jgi:hypothetical protein
MMCETAFTIPKAPKTSPTSFPLPIARKLTAPRDWSAGWPPLVNAASDVKSTKRGWEDVGDIATSALADASVKSDMAAMRLSKRIAEARWVGVGFLVETVRPESKYARMTVVR